MARKKSYYDYNGQMMTIKQVAELEGCSIQNVYDRMKAFEGSGLNLYEMMRVEILKGSRPMIFRLINVNTGVILEGTPSDLKELLGSASKVESINTALNDKADSGKVYLGEWKVSRVCKQEGINVSAKREMTHEWQQHFKAEWEKACKQLRRGA